MEHFSQSIIDQIENNNIELKKCITSILKNIQTIQLRDSYFKTDPELCSISMQIKKLITSSINEKEAVDYLVWFRNETADMLRHLNQFCSNTKKILEAPQEKAIIPQPTLKKLYEISKNLELTLDSIILLTS